MFRVAITALSIVTVGASLPGSALAASCEQLRFELANLHDDPASRSEARKYARAIAEQKSSLRQLNFTMRQEGCSAGSMVVLDQALNADCDAFEKKKARMERNLEILEKKRLSLMSEGSLDIARQELAKAIDGQGCNARPLLDSTPDDGFGEPPLVSDDVYGRETIRVPEGEPEYGDAQFVDLGGAAVNGSFRTMCVRTCDGAYFPVSSHASSLNFRRDAQVCSMMCPGTETELYYHSIRQESADMRSASTGRGYDELPNAFRFRTERPTDKAQCGCNFSLYYREMLRREAYVKGTTDGSERQSSITWIRPELRGGLRSEQTEEVKPKSIERNYVQSEKIRIIGPRFLPDDGGLDFKHPTGSVARKPN